MRSFLLLGASFGPRPHSVLNCRHRASCCLPHSHWKLPGLMSEAAACHCALASHSLKALNKRRISLGLELTWRAAGRSAAGVQMAFFGDVVFVCATALQIGAVAVTRDCTQWEERWSEHMYKQTKVVNQASTKLRRPSKAPAGRQQTGNITWCEWAAHTLALHPVGCRTGPRVSEVGALATESCKHNTLAKDRAGIQGMVASLIDSLFMQAQLASAAVVQTFNFFKFLLHPGTCHPPSLQQVWYWLAVSFTVPLQLLAPQHSNRVAPVWQRAAYKNTIMYFQGRANVLAAEKKRWEHTTRCQSPASKLPHRRPPHHHHSRCPCQYRSGAGMWCSLRGSRRGRRPREWAARRCTALRAVWKSGKPAKQVVAHRAGTAGRHDHTNRA